MNPATMRLRIRPRWKFLGAVVGVLLLSGVALAYFADVPFGGVRLQQAEADLHQQLPDGSSWEEAQEWFASRGITPGEMIHPDGRRMSMAGGIPNDTLSDSAEIRIVLNFDDEEKLRERVIQRFVFSVE